jgi:NAD(P)-dependent dehydrogenase (short-subunit alcohol dehydrogenase family)
VRLKDQVAIITGAGQGLGRAMALAFAREGASVIVADVNEQTACTVAAEIRQGGGRALAVTTDVTDRASVNACVEHAVKSFGTISVLINNAMFARYGPIEETTADVLDKMLAVGLKGPLLMTSAVVPVMRAAKTGTILNMSSAVGLAGIAFSSAYAALKGGIDAVTRALATELGSDGIRVNSIAPSAIPTEMSRRTLDEQGWEERRRRTPLGAIGSEDDVAWAAVFLASGEAKFITGAVLPVDGGFSMAAMLPGVDIATVQRSRS